MLSNTLVAPLNRINESAMDRIKFLQRRITIAGDAEHGLLALQRLVRSSESPIENR